MSEFTPGPWALETVKTSSGICHKVGPFPWRRDQPNHACIYVDNASHDGSSPIDQELLANARLIAAAPDLLAALQAMVALDECEAHMEEAYERILPRALAAIARATTPVAAPSRDMEGRK